MKYVFLFFCFSLAIFACKVEPEAKQTLTDTQLREIFKELVIASEAVQLYAKENQDSVRDVFMDQIAEIHQIPREEIELNMDILKADEKKFLEFCDTVSIYFRDIHKKTQYGQSEEADELRVVDKKDK